jgi:Na+/H+ antiporter NhaD/arsenite permease-like protein
MAIPILVLAVVFLLIALRHLLPRRLEIWQIMLGGAVAVLLTGQISPKEAAASIDLDVMLFLFGMFVVGRAMEESGYLAHLSYRLFRRAHSVNSLVLSILFVMGFLSALVMNDTVAIIGVPVVLLLAKKHGISPKLLLLTLAFSVTIGSTMSPIGNPQKPPDCREGQHRGALHHVSQVPLPPHRPEPSDCLPPSEALLLRPIPPRKD